jgi:hypothetical protein
MATSERIFVDQENLAPEGALMAAKRGKLTAVRPAEAAAAAHRPVLGEISQNVRQPPFLRAAAAAKPAAQVKLKHNFTRGCGSGLTLIRIQHFI